MMKKLCRTIIAGLLATSLFANTGLFQENESKLSLHQEFRSFFKSFSNDSLFQKESLAATIQYYSA